MIFHFQTKRKRETTDPTIINIPSPLSKVHSVANTNDALQVHLSPNKSFSSINPVCRICHEGMKHLKSVQLQTILGLKNYEVNKLQVLR